VTPRVVKDLVQNLRTNFVGQICASRDGEAGGYFLAATYDEVKSAAAPMRRQAIAMLRVVRAMEGPQHNIEEMLGQLRLELEAQ
jgi:DNA-binding IscR family transcriptional regulator